MQKLIATNDNIFELVKSEVAKNGIQCSLNHIDVKNVLVMRGLFNPKMSEIVFNGDISGWDVSNVIDMSRMFQGSIFSGDISNWNTKNVVYMNSMFENSVFNNDISKWNVTKLRNAHSIFRNSIFNGEIGGWDVSSVEMFFEGFKNSKINTDLEGWKLSSVLDIEDLFGGTEFSGNLANYGESINKSALGVEKVILLCERNRLNASMLMTCHAKTSKIAL